MGDEALVGVPPPKLLLLVLGSLLCCALALVQRSAVEELVRPGFAHPGADDLREACLFAVECGGLVDEIDEGFVDEDGLGHWAPGVNARSLGIDIPVTKRTGYNSKKS